ncbi:MAG: type III toxin-antitoxin system TenpIN family toxin [Thomasclavelia sp.]
MYKCEIKKLREQFYKDYPHDQYQEILTKKGRSYDVVLFEIDYLTDRYVCVPFRTEMKHNNGYKFKFSDRSKKHQSGLDFSKLVFVSKYKYIGESSTIDVDEYKEFEKQEDYIHKNLEKYMHDYIEHINGQKRLHSKQFERKYKYSTLKYFHEELRIVVND